MNCSRFTFIIIIFLSNLGMSSQTGWLLFRTLRSPAPSMFACHLIATWNLGFSLSLNGTIVLRFSYLSMSDFFFFAFKKKFRFKLSERSVNFFLLQFVIWFAKRVFTRDFSSFIQIKWKIVRRQGDNLNLNNYFV